MVARPSPAGSREAGFTYVGMVFFVAMLGLVGAATLKVDTLLRRAAGGHPGPSVAVAAPAK